MGDAVVAISGGLQAVQWNPAGIARSDTAMAQGGLGLIPAEAGFQFNTGILYPLSDGTVFALSQFSDFLKNDLENDYVASVGLPLNSSKDLLFGFNMKYVVLRTLVEDSLENGRGLGLDLGLTYDWRDELGEIASFGLAIKDADTSIRFDNNAEETTTRSYVLGAAYERWKDTRLEMDLDILDHSLPDDPEHDRLRIGAERFFDNRFYSLRMGYEDLFNADGVFSIGGGYHPNEPFEISYSMQLSVNSGQASHHLSFVYYLDDLLKKQPQIERPVEASSQIDIGTLGLLNSNNHQGRPVSAEPLQKIALSVSPGIFSPLGAVKTTTIGFPGVHSPLVAKWYLEVDGPNQVLVKTFVGTGTLLPSIIWDGSDEKGQIVPEGDYGISLKTYDENNNILSDDQAHVEVGEVPSSGLQIYPAVNYFSASSNREARFIFKTQEPIEVKSWTFHVVDRQSGVLIYERTGQMSLPEFIQWNGSTTTGSPIQDGRYDCSLDVTDVDGNEIKSGRSHLIVSNGGPKLSIDASAHFMDFVTSNSLSLTLTSSDDIGFRDWNVEIKDESGSIVKAFTGPGAPPVKLDWDGKQNNGSPIANGAFVNIVLSATDKAGNSDSSDPVPVQVAFDSTSLGERMVLNLASIQFAPSSSDLDAKAQADVKSAEASIQPYVTKSLIVVKGYADPAETGDPVMLSHQRALAVKAYLSQLGISASQILDVGYGNPSSNPTGTPGVTGNLGKVIITLEVAP